MRTKYSERFGICVTLLVWWWPIAVVADAGHPLEPLDLSSPRATLNTFLMTGDAYFQLLTDEYWETPSRAAAARLHEMGVKAERTLDLSEAPPAARFEMGRDGIIYLYEVLSRIELPPAADIPDAAAYDKKTDGKPASWTIPHTEITIARVAEGPRAGEFLFSPSTVARAADFYRKTRALPYRRDVPLKNYAEKRDYLSMASWMIPPRAIEGFPDWLKRGVYEQAVWKWFALAVLIPLTIALFMLVHRLARCGTRRQSVTAHLCRLVTPLTLLLLTPLMLDMSNRELTLTGWVAEDLTLVADAVGIFRAGMASLDGLDSPCRAGYRLTENT
jgi:MscS family membrane protein